MRFLSYLFIGLLALSPGRAWAQEASSVPPQAAPPKAEEAEEEVPEVDFSFRDPFQSFLPVHVAQRGEMEEPDWMRQEELIPEEEVLDLSQFTVTGLVWGLDEARAIIDDQILAVGDTIREAQILRIDREGILFDFHGREYLLERNL